MTLATLDEVLRIAVAGVVDTRNCLGVVRTAVKAEAARPLRLLAHR